MLDIPGYRVLGTIRATGSNVLFQAVREADGLPVIIKTPMTPTPGPSESERYRREFPSCSVCGTRVALSAPMPSSASASGRCCCWRRCKANPCPSSRADRSSSPGS